MIETNSTSDDHSVGFSVANETSQQVKVWLEPYCQFADVAPNKTVGFRASLLGGPNPTELAAAFQDIANKLTKSESSPGLEIVLGEQKDGSLILTLWVDQSDELEYG